MKHYYSFGSEEAKNLRLKISDHVSIQKYPTKFYGRFFFFLTVLLTITGQLALSFAIHHGDILTIILCTFALGFILVRYQFILHEAAHGVLSRYRLENELYGKIAGYIVGYPFKNYRQNHSKHHTHTATEYDFEFDNFIDFESNTPARIQFIKKILKSILLIDCILLIKKSNNLSQ